MYKLVLAAASLALATPAPAQTAGPGDQQGAVSAATAQFVRDAAMADMFEVQAGLLALKIADDPAYLDFAQLMIADHDNASEQFKKTAANLQGVQLPQQLDSAHKQKIDELSSLSGAAFERQYKAEQTADDKQAVAMFESYAKSGDNSELKSWAQETLATLATHLQQAKALPDPRAEPTTGSGARSQ